MSTLKEFLSDILFYIVSILMLVVIVVSWPLEQGQRLFDKAVAYFYKPKQSDKDDIYIID